MKTLKTIKELISFRMDENKIWWLDYDWSGTDPLTRKQIREYDYEIYKFCEEHNFEITPESYYVFSPQPYFPLLLFPKVILKHHSLGSIGFQKRYPNQGNPSPHYGSAHYRMYIDKNNGECPLPLPNDLNSLSFGIPKR